MAVGGTPSKAKYKQMVIKGKILEKEVIVNMVTAYGGEQPKI